MNIRERRFMSYLADIVIESGLDADWVAGELGGRGESRAGRAGGPGGRGVCTRWVAALPRLLDADGRECELCRIRVPLLRLGDA